METSAIEADADALRAGQPLPDMPHGEAFGQPKGLWVLAGTELWDRISFHGMVAMLTLYMAAELLLPGRVENVVGFAAYRHWLEGITGPLSVQALATQTFGLYFSGITFMPLFGGAIGDRLIGRKAAVSIGALLMTGGHFAMAFDASFLLALVLLVLGAGLLRGNLSAQVKALYAEGDPRAINAFQWYYLSINFGAFIAPIVAGGVAAIWGWHAGFGIAGFGMLIGLLLYLFGQKHLVDEKPRRLRPAAERGPRAALTADERRRVLGLALIWPISVAFWIAQAQIWNVYNIWVRDHVDMQVGSFSVPVPWMQSLDGLAPAIFTPIVLGIFAWQARRGTEPDVYVKLAIGAGIFALGTAWLGLAQLVYGEGRAPILWPIWFHVLSNFGAVYFAPTMLAVFATRAPASLRGTMIGINSLAVSAASLISGPMGGMYETMTPGEFWLINTAICAGGALAVLVLRPFYRRLLALDGEEAWRGAAVPA